MVLATCYGNLQQCTSLFWCVITGCYNSYTVSSLYYKEPLGKQGFVWGFVNPLYVTTLYKWQGTTNDPILVTAGSEHLLKIFCIGF